MSKTQSASGLSARLFLLRRGLGSGRSSRRITSFSLSAVAAAALGAAALAPAMASNAPSMTVNGNDVNIAAMGPNHRLKFYWAVNGTPTWHSEQVAPPGGVR